METLEVSLSCFQVQAYPIKITQHLPLRFGINILVRLAGPDANVDQLLEAWHLDGVWEIKLRHLSRALKNQSKASER